MNNKFEGMTVNERLYSENLDDKYYEAIKEKNIVKLVFILMRIDLKEESIIEILKSHNLYSSQFVVWFISAAIGKSPLRGLISQQRLRYGTLRIDMTFYIPMK